MTNKTEAINQLVGGAFTVKADGSVDYHSEQTPPTEKEINDKLTELRAEYDSKSYARERQKNFPNEHDLLIALWEKVMEERSESADALQIIRTQVKSDNPKPE